MNNAPVSLLDELRNTLGKMEIALGSINEAIAWTDADGVIQWCNKAFDKLFGQSHLLHLGKNIFDILPLRQNGQDLPSAAHPLQLALRSQSSTHGVYQFAGRGKRTLEISVNLFAMGADAQSAVIVLHDISEIEKLEQIRLQSVALAATASAIVITDALGEVVWLNDAFVAMTGYTLEAVYGKNMRFLKSDVQDRSFYEDLWRTISRGEVWKGVLINRRADGTEYYEGQTITPVQNTAGEITHFIAIKSDITEKKLYQKKLKKLEAKRKAVVSSLVEGIITITSDGIIETINPAGAKMFGYTEEELIGENVKILMPQPQRQLHDTYLRRYIETRIPRIIGFERELVAQHRNGHTFPIEISISAIELEDELLFSAVIRNITKRKLFERQMEEMNTMLIEKQIKLGEDLTAAAQIQKALLPQNPPTLPNLAMAWRFKPSTYVSGDIFNYFFLDEDTIAVYLLDVSGHGVPAAMIALSVSQLLHPKSRFVAKAYVNNTFSPSHLLELLDEEFPIERFEKHFTIVFLTLQMKTGRVLYSNAGHPYPVHCDTHGECTDLEYGGSIIGLGNVVPFSEGSLQLKKGERIYLFTDGAVEHESNSGEQFGLERLKKIIDETQQSPLNTAIDQIYNAVLQFEKKKAPLDDVTFVAVEYL